MPDLQLPLGQEGRLVSNGRPVQMRGMPKRDSAYLPRQGRTLREARTLGLVAARDPAAAKIGVAVAATGVLGLTSCYRPLLCGGSCGGGDGEGCADRERPAALAVVQAW